MKSNEFIQQLSPIAIRTDVPEDVRTAVIGQLLKPLILCSPTSGFTEQS